MDDSNLNNAIFAGTTQPPRGGRGGREWVPRRQGGAAGRAAVGARVVPHAAHAPRRQGGAGAAAGLQGLARVRAAPADDAQLACEAETPQGSCLR